MTRLTSSLKGHTLTARFAALCLFAAAALLFPGPAHAQWATNGNDIHTTNTGNVGVGTTTPTNGKVEIVSDTGVTSGEHSFLYASRSGVSSGGFRFGYRANGTAVTGGFARSLNNLPFFLGTTGSPLALTIDNVGNVGVGTTAPQALFHLWGANASAYSSSSVPVMGQRLTNSDVTNNSALSLRFSTLDTAGVEQTAAAISTVFTSHAASGVSGDLVFQIKNAGIVKEAFRINSAGNLGVGTTAPSHPLEVSRAQAAVTMFQVTNANATAGNGAAVRLFTSGNNALTLSAQENAGLGGYASINQEANLPLLIKTSNAERVRITGAGNVGIGNTNPGSQLFVGSGTPAVATLSGLNVALGGNSYVSASNGAVNTFIGSDVSPYGIVGTLSNHPLGLRANNVLAVTVMPAGNVGIGTSSPTQRLDVAGNANASGLCIAGDCKTAWSQVGGASQWATSGSGINYNTGNVGVGTASPDQRLGVQGMFGLYPQAWAQPSSRGMFMFHGGGGGSIYAYNYPTGTPDPITISASTLDFNTYTGGSAIQRMFIANSGNIGVGTDAPASLLNLVGANAALTFGTAGGSDSSSFSVAVTASGTNTNAGHGRGLTVKAGDSDNAAGKVGGSLTLNPGAPASPATAHGNVLMATAGGNVGVGTASPVERLDVRGNLILDAGASPNLYTGAAAAELNRYLHVLNSPGHSSASGLKAGGLLVADDYGYAHPAKTDVVVKGRVGIGTAGAAAYKLDVAGSVNSSGLCLGGDCKTAWSQVGGAGSQWTTSGTSINYGTGSVGIGTSSPTYSLDVNGGSNGFRVKAATSSASDAVATIENASGVQAIFRGNGNVGIGTTNPLAKLSVVGGANTALLVGDRGTSGSVGLQFLGSGYRHAGVRFDGDNVVVESASVSHLPSTWHASGQALNFVVRNGNVGINKTNPTEALDVVGNITATGNIAAKYQDVAEWVPSTQRLAPGTVVVLDRGRNNHVLASTSSYDTGVAGVISAQPGVILGEGGADKLMVATTGRVRIKVDATHAPILIGDLLVTSDVAGVAMKSEPVAFGGRKMHSPGTIIGKALEPLASGKGEILVLLSLQ